MFATILFIFIQGLGIILFNFIELLCIFTLKRKSRKHEFLILSLKTAHYMTYIKTKMVGKTLTLYRTCSAENHLNIMQEFWKNASNYL